MLEKSNNKTINMKTSDKIHSQVFPGKRLLSLILVMLIFLPEMSFSQTRAGVAFLKILPGVRNQGLGGNYTGVLDEMHAVYANPGATGFIREWQWSTNYTEWIADTYSLSWTVGSRLRTPLSDQMRFAFGVHYQGVRDFNSTANPNAIQASANDALFNLSLGTPIISDNLSLGATVKYFRSDLDGLTSSSVIADLGLLYQSNRMGINLLNMEYAIFSAGLAINQLGQPMEFIGVETPLPRTVRTGVALNLGAHDGLQVQLSADYRNIRDEVNAFSLGAEVGWSNNIGIRGGYNFNDNLLSKFALGVSYRWGDTQPLPGRKNALKLDFAYLEGNEFFDPPIRGGLSHFPVGPEHFGLDFSEMQTFSPSDTIELGWDKARDPDLFDDVTYVMLMAKDDSLALAKLVSEIDEDSQVLFDWLEAERAEDASVQLVTQLAAKIQSENPMHALNPAPAHKAGDYYWTVLAHDRDNHVRPADNIGHYRITLPDIKIHYIEFDPVITENCQEGDPCSGEIRVLVSNIGNTAAENIAVNIYEDIADAQEILATTTPTVQIQSDSLRLIANSLTISSLKPEERVTLSVPWQRTSTKVTSFIAIADPDSVIEEKSETNNIVLQALPFPDLSVDIAAVPDGVQPGDTVVYNLTVINAGSAEVTAKDIVLELDTPADLKILTADSTNGGRFSWTIDSLAPGQNRSFSFKAKVAESETFNSVLSNARITSVNCDINPFDNCVVDTLPVYKYDVMLASNAAVQPLRPRVTFELNKAELTPGARKELNVLGAALVEPELAGVFIKLGGHTDQRGRASYNKDLSDRRVKSVRNYFIEQFDVEPERIFAHGYGLEFLLENANDVPRSRRREVHDANRRVELFFLKEEDADTTNRGIADSSMVVAAVEGTKIFYEIFVTNRGPDPAEDIIVTEHLNEFTRFEEDRANAPLPAEVQGDKIVWRIAKLAPGEKIRIRYALSASGDIPRNLFPLSNSTSVSAEHDGVSGNNKDSDTVFIIKRNRR